MRKHITQWIGFFIMLIGLLILSGPFLLGAYGEKMHKKMVRSIISEMRGESPESEKTESYGKEDSGVQNDNGDKESGEKEIKIIDSSKAIRYEDMYRDAKQYNESLLLPGAQDMEAKSVVEAFDLDARDYGFSENVVGILRVPRLGIELCIYLGSSEENMAKGVAAFGKTSLPLGEGDENTSISGHRGWRGTEVFRNIQLLQEGDPIYITTPWKTLCYRVSEFRIVTPEENSWCKIQKGRTLVTLMTCHPYGNNNQRYIVFADYVGEGMPTEEEMEKENAATYKNEARKVIEVKPNGTTEIVEVSPEKVEADGSEYGAVYSNVMILAENRMKIVAIVFAFLVLIAGIWLTIVMVKDGKRSDNEE